MIIQGSNTWLSTYNIYIDIRSILFVLSGQVTNLEQCRVWLDSGTFADVVHQTSQTVCHRAVDDAFIRQVDLVAAYLVPDVVLLAIQRFFLGDDVSLVYAYKLPFFQVFFCLCYKTKCFIRRLIKINLTILLNVSSEITDINIDRYFLLHIILVEMPWL